MTVPVRNPGALAQAMTELASNDARRTALSERAHSAAAEFGVDAVAERLAGIYWRLAQGQQQQPKFAAKATR